jgi:hypothetical protein
MEVLAKITFQLLPSWSFLNCEGQIAQKNVVCFTYKSVNLNIQTKTLPVIKISKETTDLL